MSPDSNQREFSLAYVIGRVDHGIRREMRLRLTDHRLSVQQYTALSVLSSRPGLSNAQLARRALVTPQSMIEILSKLERRGLVRRDVDPRHGRILRTELTPAGRRLLTEVDPAMVSMQAQILADVPEADRAILLAGMRSVMDRLSTGLKTE
jgi:DNA-binding MarR family transcriptional regulator